MKSVIFAVHFPCIKIGLEKQNLETVKLIGIWRESTNYCNAIDL